MGAIPVGVILLHPSTVASIPSGWIRETALDGRFPKAWGAQAQNVGGGANSHSHLGVSHSHSETDNHGHSATLDQDNSSATFGGSPNQDQITNPGHAHPARTINGISGGVAADTIAYPATANNNRPPYFDFIFIKPNGTPAAITPNIIGLWNNVTLPNNWLACTDGSNGAPALGNKYARGKDASGDGGTTGGSLTHSHDLSHSHLTSHSHSGQSSTDNNHRNSLNSGGSGGIKIGQHEHTIYLAANTVTTDTVTASVTSGTVEPTYKKLIAIQRQSNGISLPRGLIALWLGNPNTPPAGFKVCNGQAWEDGVTYTPDMRDLFLKFANTTGEIGNTGGANTHSHAANNSHSHSQSGAHTHTGSSSYASGGGPYGSYNSPSNHSHSVSSIGNNDATLTWDAQQIAAAESVDNQPEYLTVVFIQLTKVNAGAAGLMI